MLQQMAPEITTAEHPSSKIEEFYATSWVNSRTANSLNTAPSIEQIGCHRGPRDRTSHWGKAAMPKNSKPTGV